MGGNRGEGMPCDAVAGAGDGTGMGNVVTARAGVGPWLGCVMYGCRYSEAVYAAVGTNM